VFFAEREKQSLDDPSPNPTWKFGMLIEIMLPDLEREYVLSL
jgi:hypothetical protein